MQRRAQAALLLLIAAFVVLGGIRIGALGIPSEEILPHLFRHPIVASRASLDRARLVLKSPYDLPAGGERSGLVVSDVWPALSIVRPPVSYPILTESWQAAHLSYVAAALKPLLGGGIEGLRRSNLLLGALGLSLVFALAQRLQRPKGEQEPWLGVIAAAWLATSVSYLFLHRFAYLIESGPPLAAALALLWVLDGRASRFVLAGFAAGLAVALKITASWVLLGALAYLLLARRVPRHRPRVWISAALAALAGAAPLLLHFGLGGSRSVVGQRLALASDPLGVLGRLPRVAWSTAAYLGHPDALLAPLFSGERSIKWTAWSIAVPLAVTAFAVFRVARRPADRDPELLWLCAAIPFMIFAALFYASDTPFQSAFFLAPFYAVVVARALVALARALAARAGRLPAAAVVLALCAALQGSEIARFIAAHRSIGNPMLAMDAQRALASELARRGASRPLTVTYNAAGFFEFLSNSTVVPVHLYPMLLPAPGMSADRYLAASTRAFRIALAEARGPIVIPVGGNAFEGGRQDLDVIRAALRDACAVMGLELREVARVPPTGPALFALYEASGDASGAPPVEPALDASPDATSPVSPASSETRALLGGLEPGQSIGPFIIRSIDGPAGGVVLVRARGSSVDVTFEVRLFSVDPSPPASARGYAIYYRNSGGSSGGAPSLDRVAGARALADRIASAPPDAPLVPGLTRYPARPPP